MYLRWEKLTEGGYDRYYEVRVAHDLFNDLILQRIWGRKESPLGNKKNMPILSWKEAHQILKKIQYERRRKGYHLVKNL